MLVNENPSNDYLAPIVNKPCDGEVRRQAIDELENQPDEVIDAARCNLPPGKSNGGKPADPHGPTRRRVAIGREALRRFKQGLRFTISNLEGVEEFNVTRFNYVGIDIKKLYDFDSVGTGTNRYYPNTPLNIARATLSLAKLSRRDLGIVAEEFGSTAEQFIEDAIAIANKTAETISSDDCVSHQRDVQLILA